MVSTRSAQKPADGSDASTAPSIGSKRKAEASSGKDAKRGKKAEKEQKTIEETIVPPTEDGKSKDTEMTDAKPPVEDEKDAEAEVEAPALSANGAAQKEADAEPSKKEDDEPSKKAGETEASSQDAAAEKKAGKQSDEPETDDAEGQDAAKEEQPNGDSADKGAPSTKVSEKENGQAETSDKASTETSEKQGDSSHATDTPNSILEKGLIYFFFRGRINIDDPSNVQDVARSYIVLRPFAHDATLGTSGPVNEAADTDREENFRVLALPKKFLPKSPQDRFMVFVEHAKIGIQAVKEKVLQSSDYDTATQGARHAPAAKPIGEGVYAVTSTGRETHLAYMLTLPKQLGEVQRDVGLAEKGSFVMSAKNPQQKGPANASLPQGPGYPEEIISHFRTLRWASVLPTMLDHPNAQFLLIGGADGDLKKATEPQEADVQEGKDEPLQELEKLEGADEIRTEGLKGDHAVFEDLGLSRKEYAELQTAW